MANFVEDYLELARYVAMKTRRLVPRSANRIGGGQKVDYVNSVGGRGTPVGFTGSGWKKQSWEDRKDPSKYYYYIHLQLLAKRSNLPAEKSKVIRNLLSANQNLSIDVTPSEAKRIEVEYRKYVHKNAPWYLRGWHDYQTMEKVRKYIAGRSIKLTTVTESIDRAIEYGIGNCGECAQLAYTMFLEFNGTDNMEGLVYGPKKILTGEEPWVQRLYWKGDHCFVIIHPHNVLPNSFDISDYTNWYKRSDIIVCDPWAFHIGNAYPAPHADVLWNIFGLDNSKKIEKTECAKIGSGHKGKNTYLSYQFEKELLGGHTSQHRKPPIPSYKDKQKAKQNFGM